MRLFVAIDFPDSVTADLTGIQPAPNAGIRPIPRHDIHLTLHFIGEAEPFPISNALREVVFPPFSLTIAGVGRFTSRDGGIVLWAGVEESRELQELHFSIGQSLAQMQVKLETRPYSPHVTLARCKPNAPANLIDRFLAQNENISITDIPILKFTLYSTRFVDNVPVYHCERIFPLLGSGGC